MVTEVQARVANATVIVRTKERGSGQGVLVPGGFILTAAHCVDWDHEGPMTFEDRFVQKIHTASGKELIVSPCAVEPVSDIAVLRAPDREENYEDSNAFDEFCENTLPIPLSTDPHDFGVWFPISVLSHHGNWINGRADQFQCDGQAQSLCIETDEPVICGTSGGPIINERGELVGIVSVVVGAGQDTNKPEINGGCKGSHPRPHLTLPVWMWQAILKATTAAREESGQ